MRTTIFKKDDYAAFEGLELDEIELFGYQLMPSHYHLVLRPLVDGEMSRSVALSNATHFALDLCGAAKIGVGCRSPSRTRDCFPRGLCRGCQAGSTASTHHCLRENLGGS